MRFRPNKQFKLLEATGNLRVRAHHMQRFMRTCRDDGDAQFIRQELYRVQSPYCPNIRTMPFDVLRGCGMGRVSEGPIYSPAMFPLLQSVQMLLLMFAGWVNRHQLDVIEYLQEENRVLKERMGGRRLRFTDAERRRLARKAQALGAKS